MGEGHCACIRKRVSLVKEDSILDPANSILSLSDLFFSELFFPSVILNSRIWEITSYDGYWNCPSCPQPWFRWCRQDCTTSPGRRSARPGPEQDHGHCNPLPFCLCSFPVEPQCYCWGPEDSPLTCLPSATTPRINSPITFAIVVFLGGWEWAWSAGIPQGPGQQLTMVFRQRGKLVLSGGI